MRCSWPGDRGCSHERCPASESWAWHVPWPNGPVGQAKLTTALSACMDTSNSLGVSGSVERKQHVSQAPGPSPENASHSAGVGQPHSRHLVWS